MRSRVRLLLAILAVLVLALLAVVLLPSGHPPDKLPGAGTLRTAYPNGRSGAFLLPAGHQDRPLPLLTLLHGTGGSGMSLLPLVQEAANARHFAVVAPDSEFADHWDVPDHPGETSKDSDHVIACVREVIGMEHIVIDRQRVLIAGISGGGSTAPFEASTYDEFGAFAVLHGGVYAGGLGPRRVRGWFSTGQMDRFRPVEGVSKAVDAVRSAGFEDVRFNIYPGGHEISPTELNALLDWWLGP